MGCLSVLVAAATKRLDTSEKLVLNSSRRRKGSSRTQRASIREVLKAMLQVAGYGEHKTQLQVNAYDRLVRGYLDDPLAADRIHWKSFMTDDYTPVELSWSWTDGAALPVVRYSVDPISSRSGTWRDCTNLRTAARFRRDAERIFGDTADWTWFDALYEDLVISRCPRTTLKNTPSQVLFSFDLVGDRQTLKAYLVPSVRACRQRVTNEALVRNALLRLEPDEEVQAAYSTFFEFLDSFEAHRPAIEMLGIDCVEPTRSRMKIYVRSRQTSFEEVVRMMTLGGMVSVDLPSLEALMAAVLGKETVNSLLEVGHRTSGYLYYYEFHPHSKSIKAKIYIPVRHYAPSDGFVATGMGQYLKSRGFGLDGVEYSEALQRSLPQASLEDIGAHTYITYSYSGGKVTLSSYINPQFRR